jgi:CPA1 family monovalent cation:H+ antiporter
MRALISAFESASVIVTAAAAAAYLNHLTLRLPQTIALTLSGALVSLVVAVVDRLWPSLGLGSMAQGFMSSIDFRTALLNVMLSFLLFAGALHVDLSCLRRAKWPIAVLSTAGVLLSTAIVGVGFWLTARLFQVEAPLAWCLVFGALISPTDPVAVIAILQRSATPPLLKTTVAAESLFNDGVGIVVFTVLVAMAAGGGSIEPLAGVEMFAFEALGGVMLGAVVGFIAYLAIRTIDDYATEALITLALVMGGYALAARLGVSGPVAMAVAGLIIGNLAAPRAMSETSRDHLLKFWDLIDQLLNASLFLLIGLQGIQLLGAYNVLAVGLVAIPLTLAARAASISPALMIWRKLLPFRETFPILTWGGLRGGIAVAMALSLPEIPARNVILISTYAVVMFSVLVQGVTVQPLVDRMSKRPK